MPAGAVRSGKRKADAIESPAASNRSAKKQRTPKLEQDAPETPTAPNVPDTQETAETTSREGLKFIEQLKEVRDKSGRLISTAFLDLPSKKDIPEYYEQILLPIAISTIENKLRNGEYSKLSYVESDVKRMVHNAKQFNETNSEIFQDAERIRKNSSNWMTRHNPAYNTRGYVAFATPIPDLPRRKTNEDESMKGPPEFKKGDQSGAIARSKQKPKADQDVEADRESFEGKTFQEAQEQIVEEMINYEDEEGFTPFAVFVTLPPRSLADYYANIRHPQSLKGIQKRVKGVHGRNETTGVSDFRSWTAFENEVRYIWDNAREYNIEESEIYEVAGELEEFFKKRLAEAKKVVDEPHQPTLKLNMAPTPAPIKLRLGSQKVSPVPPTQPKADSPAASAAPAGVNVDRSALERQKQLVQAGVNGYSSPQPPATSSSSRPPSRDVRAVSTTRSSSHPAGATPGPVNGIKSETSRGQSPAPNAQQVPVTVPTGQLTNGQPGVVPVQPQVNGVAVPSASPYPGHPYGQPPVPFHSTFDGRFRPEGKSAKDALLTNINLRTHPDLPIPRALNMDIKPDDNLSQQSVTLNLAPTHYVLQLEPSLAESLGTLATGGGRPFKLFVTVNGQRMQANNLQDARRLQFDARLMPGVNRIEVECVTIASAPRTAPGGELEMEKTTIFVHLMK